MIFFSRKIIQLMECSSMLQYLPCMHKDIEFDKKKYE